MSSSKAYGTVPLISTEQLTQSATLIAVKNKQGHSCCGGCCDVRRAVIVVDLVMIGLLLFDIIGIVSILHHQTQPLEDDELEQAAQSIHGGFGIFMFLVEIGLLCVAIWGAITFSAQKVSVGLAVYGIGCIMSLVRFNLPAVLVTGLFAYPHYFLYQEINAGIMSQENYYNEEQSCCCV